MILAIAAIFFLIIVLLFWYGSTLETLFYNAPFVPTGRRDVKRILDLAQIKKGTIFYDLGSGDGRFVRAAASRGAEAIGIERSLFLVLWSRLLAYLTHLPNAKFTRGNFFKIPLQNAEVIYCYLMPECMATLSSKFTSELKTGTRIIARAFALPGWEAATVHRFSKRSAPVYEYRR